MATLNVPQNGQAMKGRNRTRKPVPAVDLTAMVDLAFLLITFFMLTTSLSKSQAMDVAKPLTDIPQEPIPASRTVTVLLGKDNQLMWYKGEPEKANPERSNFSTIGKVLNGNKQAVLKEQGNDRSKFMIVVIKPTEKSTYKDYVNILDEMKIADVKSYLIDDEHLLDAERNKMKELGVW